MVGSHSCAWCAIGLHTDVKGVRGTVVDRLCALLPEDAARRLMECRDSLTEIRLRSGRPVQLCGSAFGEVWSTEVLSFDALRRLLSALMEFSIYARQGELDQGFFTLEDGSRVGVCGRMYECGEGLRLGEIGSACVRVARALPGCADALMGEVCPGGVPRSMLLLSPPGLGKTTLLRDIAHQLSDGGCCVGIADERREIAACRQGVPTLDVGARTDVMDGCARGEAIARLVRCMSPRVIVADEIGGPGDAMALSEAARCGVSVVATAHGDGLADARRREGLVQALRAGVFQSVAVLGPRPGAIREIWRWERGEGADAWRRA